MSSFESLDSGNREKNDAKKRKLHSTVQLNSQEKDFYTPIASLTHMLCCPLIRGTITSTSKWRMTNCGTRYANFVLEDDSGQIDGVIFRTTDWALEKQFVVGAKFSVAGAVVKPVNPNYRKNSNHLYELSIPNDCQTVECEDPVIDDRKPRTVVRSFDPKNSINDLIKNIQPGETISVVGLVISCEPETFQRSPLGFVECRKKLILRDVEDYEMEVVIHGRASSRYEFPTNSVVVLKNAILNVEGIKSKLIVEWTDFHLAPPSPEMQKIKQILKSPAIASVEPSPVTSFISNKRTVQNQRPECATEFKEAEKYEKSVSIVKPRVEPAIPSTSGKSVQSNFTKISVILDSVAVGSIVDVLGVITCRESPTNVNCSNGMKIKMSVLLSDETGGQIWMVVWGPHVEKIKDRKNIIIAAKRVQVRFWNNLKELNCTDKMSSLVVDPEIDEVEILQKWVQCHEILDWEADVEDGKGSVRIADLKNSTIVSILGIVTKVNEVQILRAEYICDYARTIEMIDISEKTISLALWGDWAQNFEIRIESVVYATKVKIHRSEKILGAMTWSSRLFIDPPAFREKIKRLQDWFLAYKSSQLRVNTAESS